MTAAAVLFRMVVVRGGREWGSQLQGVAEAIPHKPTSQLEQFHVSRTFKIPPPGGPALTAAQQQVPGHVSRRGRC